MTWALYWIPAVLTTIPAFLSTLKHWEDEFDDPHGIDKVMSYVMAVLLGVMFGAFWPLTITLWLFDFGRDYDFTVRYDDADETQDTRA